MSKDLIKVVNEEISKLDYLTSVDEINNDDNRTEIVNSKDFQTKLVTDIINQNKQTVTDWEEDYRVGDSKDIDDNGWGINVLKDLYRLYKFKYHYGPHIFDLNLELMGDDLPAIMSGEHIPATHLQPAEYPEAEGLDYSGVQFTFGDEEERDAIETKWLDNDEELRKKLAYSLLGPLPD